jgi:hypothetical protein
MARLRTYLPPTPIGYCLSDLSCDTYFVFNKGDITLVVTLFEAVSDIHHYGGAKDAFIIFTNLSIHLCR